MEKLRKPFQGVWNIVRFNWHFYVFAFGALLLLILLYNYINSTQRIYLLILGFFIFIPTIISLSVSYYIYDLSGLYNLIWLEDLIENGESKIININASGVNYFFNLILISITLSIAQNIANGLVSKE